MRFGFLVLGAVALVAGCADDDVKVDTYAPRFAPVPVDSAPVVPSTPSPLPAFYTQRIEIDGLTIAASSNVLPNALAEAKWLMEHVTAHDPSILGQLRDANIRFSIIAASEQLTDLPEYASYWPQKWWDQRDRGIGPTNVAPVTVGPEENLLAFPESEKYYGGYSVFVHELGHAIELARDDSFHVRLQAAYADAVANNLFTGTYAGSNWQEYWGEGTGSWFGANALSDHNSRDELRAYDPPLAALLEEVYGDEDWTWTPASERLGEGHLAGFDPAAHAYTAPPSYDPADDPAVPIIPLASGSIPSTTVKGTNPVFVFFANRGTEVIGLDTVDGAGKRTHYNWYLPGAENSLPMGYPGMVAVVKDRDGNARGSFTMSVNGKLVIE